MDVIAKKVTNMLIKRNLIKQYDREYYEVAISDMSKLVIKIIAMLAIGILFNELILTVVSAVFYIGISRAAREDKEKYSGSLLNLLILYLLTMIYIKVIAANIEIYYIVLAVASVLIFCTGGDSDADRKYTIEELNEINAFRRYALALELFVFISLFALKASTESVVILSCPVIICAVSILTSKLLKNIPSKENREQVSDTEEPHLETQNVHKFSA